MGGYENRPVKYIICTESQIVKEHQCWVTSCTKNRGKIYSYIPVKYANFKCNHMANFPCCISRQKNGIKASKQRKLIKQSKKEKEIIANKNRNNVEEKDISSQPETEIDSEAENQARSQLEKGQNLMPSKVKTIPKTTNVNNNTKL